MTFWLLTTWFFCGKYWDRLTELSLTMKPASVISYAKLLRTWTLSLPQKEYLPIFRGWQQRRVTQCRRQVKRFASSSSSLSIAAILYGFVKVAELLHVLTQKGATFNWNYDCQTAFDGWSPRRQKHLSWNILTWILFLKRIPVLKAWEQFPRNCKTTDVYIELHTLVDSPQRINELETLVVVRAMQHFNVYPYGHAVTVYIDHLAVKVSGHETPSPSTNHTSWWNKVIDSLAVWWSWKLYIGLGKRMVMFSVPEAVPLMSPWTQCFRQRCLAGQWHLGTSTAEL